MKKRICLFLAAFCMLLTACDSEAQPGPDPTSSPAAEASAPTAEEPAGPELPQRDRDWIEDIEYLRGEYKARHPDPFYRCKEEEFDWRMDQLAAKVGELSDSDIFYELAAIISGMGDTHTTLWLSLIHISEPTRRSV